MLSRPWPRRLTPDRARPWSGEPPPRCLTSCYNRLRQALRRPLESAHAADARPVPGPRIEYDEGALAPIDRYARWRHNADQRIVDRPRQGASVEHEFGFEDQNVRRLARIVLDVIVAALAQDIEQQDPPLPRIDPIPERAIHTAHKGDRLNGRGRAWHRPFGLLRHETSWPVKLFYSPDRKGQPYVQR